MFIIGVRSLFVCFQKKRPQRQADREGLCVLPPKGFCRGMGKLSPRQIRQPSKTLSPGTLLCQSSVTDHNGGTGRAAASLTASRGKDASVTAGDGEVGAGEEAPRGKARGLLVTHGQPLLSSAALPWREDEEEDAAAPLPCSECLVLSRKAAALSF